MNYVYVFYMLHMLFCLIYYVFLARTDKLAMALMPMVIFIPYVGFLGISLYFIVIKIYDRYEHLAMNEIILPTEKMKFVGLENKEKVINTVPVEEALKINDADTQRELVMEVAKRNPQDYLEALKQALLSGDSEIAHYAATSITKLKRELDKRLVEAMKEYKRDKTDEGVRREYIAALDTVVKSDLSVGSILAEYTQSIVNVLIHDISTSKKPDKNHYELLIEYLIASKLYGQAIQWVERYADAYPLDDGPLLLKLKIGYESKDEDMFKQTADSIIHADFPIRKSTLDLVEYWQFAE